VSILQTLPYARFLGLREEADATGRLVVMSFQPMLIGNPVLPALHGGATAAMLELTAIAQAAAAFPAERLPKPINVTVAYLRSGRAADVMARARIGKAGRRVAHVVAEAWQEDEAQPIATLTAHFLLGQKS
jgi:uncharacterized protein (TIGR00369 family)